MADTPRKKDDEGFGDDDDFGALTSGSSSGSGKDEGGLHSLPPLSEFDSASDGGGGQSDSDLPPLDTPGADDEGFSGLPPIVDIKVDTPAVRPSDLDTPTPGKRTPAKRTPSRRTPAGPGSAKTVATPSPAGFKTPSDSDLASPSDGGFGFQDFAADSDFSPETPEIGPGPDSDIETPMFDSAFGGDSDEFTSNARSSAPTQAMSTPTFGAAKSGGFGDDAFGAVTPDQGTPVPDFSPDTGAGMRDTGGLTPAPVGGGGRRGGGVKGVLITAGVAIIALIGGVFAGPFAIGKVPGVPNPFADDLAAKDTEIRTLQKRVDDATRATSQTGTKISPEDLDKLIAQFNEVTANKTRAEQDLGVVQEELNNLNNQLALVKADIDEKNNQFIESQELLEDLINETAITRARHEGLLAENERLTESVGELEVANARSVSTKDTLQHNAELLIIQIQGGSPLTPARYGYQERLTRANALKDKIQRAKWVDPQLLDEYTSLYLSELAIASSREYFFARIPVKDELGNTYYTWAECLMNGNWSVFFRSIDEKVVGSYENTAGSGPPKYEFRQDLPEGMRADIIEALEAARPANWEEKFKDLQEKQAIYENKTALQRNFSSLD